METSIVQNVGSKLVNIGSKAIFKIKNASPEILMGVGIASILAGTVLACRATFLKADMVLDKYSGKMYLIKQAKEKYPETYLKKDELKDKVTTYSETAIDFTKLYFPSAILMAGGVVCLLGSHGIMKQRNTAIAAAYAVVDKALKNYRGRVVDELGKEKDNHFMYGTHYETVTEEIIGEDGKKKKVKKEIQISNGDHSNPSMYSRYFEKQEWDLENGSYTGSSQWSPTPTYNASQLVLKSMVFNDQLNSRGYLFLNDVYDELGFPRTKAGQVVGWVKNKGTGDNVVSLGDYVDILADPNVPAADKTEMRVHDQSILLDFNVDGVILDLLKD